jgi:hypothetical protein
LSNALQTIVKWSAERKDPQLQVKAITATLSLLYADVQFSSVYRPTKETLRLFRMKPLLSNSNAADYRDVCSNFLSYMVRNKNDVEYSDFGLDEEETKYMSRREINTLWQEVSEI